MQLTAEYIIRTALKLGASAASEIAPAKIVFYPELLDMCEMNSCGKYASCWCCPPACGEAKRLFAQISAHENGVVFQRVGTLEDSFDYEGMNEAGKEFSRLASALKQKLAPTGALVLGAGGCHLCESCTYPAAPCRFPDKNTAAVEACGINVSELCALAGLNYINGQNTVTYSGLIAF